MNNSAAHRRSHHGSHSLPMASARTSAPPVVRNKTRIAITKTPNESHGLDPLHFLRCIEVAKLEKKGVLPNQWFGIKITDGTGPCARLSVKRCPHAGRKSRHGLERSFFFIDFLWRSTCNPVSSGVPK